LAEFDEGRPQAFEVGGEFARFGRNGGHFRRVVAERKRESARLHQVGAPVLHKQHGDVLVTLQMFGLQRNDHPTLLDRKTFQNCRLETFREGSRFSSDARLYRFNRRTPLDIP
jgi:hypothetical protein